MLVTVFKSLFTRWHDQRVTDALDVTGSLTDAQRSDLGFENPPLRPVSKFQDFELDAEGARQPSEALQYHLVRGFSS
jgi:hypothetical protein